MKPFKTHIAAQAEFPVPQNPHHASDGVTLTAGSSKSEAV
jgi:hypothetical protein